MKAKCVYDILKFLEEPERIKLFKMLKKPIPKVEVDPWLYQWGGLSKYLGGVPINTLEDWERKGLIKKYKLGRKVLFKKKEVDEAPTEV